MQPRYTTSEIIRQYTALAAMEAAEEFVSGFEDDDHQEGVKDLLELLREAIRINTPAEAD